MNKEIEKEIKKELANHYFDNLFPYEPAKSYERLLEALSILIEREIKEAYLRGAKDMREVIKGAVRGAVGVEAEGINYVLKKQDHKAQQFIDSLEKGENNE